MAGVGRDDGKSYGAGTPWSNAQAVYTPFIDAQKSSKSFRKAC